MECMNSDRNSKMNIYKSCFCAGSPAVFHGLSIFFGRDIPFREFSSHDKC